MGKRGTKPKAKVKIKWTRDFAYVIGLIATDGCLYGDKRHISFVSKDLDLVKAFHRILKLDVKIGIKKTLLNKKVSQTPHVQFGDVLFVHFLESIGIHPAKSLTISEIKIPEDLFFDFLRGCFDGDGWVYSYWDKRWKSSFMFYVGFSSGSIDFLKWIQQEVRLRIKINGHITKGKSRSSYQLKYAKSESVILLNKIYYPRVKNYLKRKKLKVEEILAILNRTRNARVEKR